MTLAFALLKAMSKEVASVISVPSYTPLPAKSTAARRVGETVENAYTRFPNIDQTTYVWLKFYLKTFLSIIFWLQFNFIM